MLSALDRKDRLRLMKFVCSFAWADLEVRPEERAYVARLIERLDLDAAERREVSGWLRVPPEARGVFNVRPPDEPRAGVRFADMTDGTSSTFAMGDAAGGTPRYLVRDRNNPSQAAIDGRAVAVLPERLPASMPLAPK